MNLLFILIQFFISLTFYNYTIPGNSGTHIRLSDFKGKKVMLVNMATSSSQLNQLSELETLQQQHKDSLVVIVIPSNSFNNEPLTNEQILSHVQNLGYFSFLLAAKSTVQGSGGLGVYKWIADKEKNKRASFEVTSDFQKVLIDKEGEIIGFFGVEINPLHQIIQNAITQ